MEKIQNGQEDPERKNRSLSYGLWALLCCAAMTVMVVFASNKAIVIADGGALQAEGMGENGEQDSETPEIPLTVEYAPEPSGKFCISLPKSIRAENIGLENRYTSRELWLYIGLEDTDFFAQHPITGDTGEIQEASLREGDRGVIIRLKMQRILEYRCTLENNMLVITFENPRDRYEHIVVLNPRGGECVLSVARLVQDKLESEAGGMRIYLIRSESAEECLALIDGVQADVYVEINVREDEAPEDSYGILGYYNGDYFIPGPGNVELADMLTKEVTMSSCNRAQGLLEADEDSLLKQLSIPGAALSIGCWTNPEERYLLEQESYREKLAEGILQGLEEFFRQREIFQTETFDKESR